MPKDSDNYTLKNSILKWLYFEKNQSCSELSEQLKKSIPLVTKTLNELIEEDYVVTNGYAPSSGGRRPMSYSLKPDKGCIVAVAMDQLFTRIRIVDLAHQRVSDPETIELDLYQDANALSTLAKAIQSHISHSGVDRDKIIAAGIGMPGFINIQEGINYTFFGDYADISHQAYLENTLGIPVFIDNDSSLTALAECKFGLARGRGNVMVINIGWGTGLGMIVNGALFRGNTGYAGEFSHIPLLDNGVLCECGKRGCLETETSLLLMAQKALEEIKRVKTSGIELKDVKYMSDTIMDAANKGDQFCVELLSHVGYTLGKGIAILIHIMNPELIILSGRGAKAQKMLMAPVQQALNQYCIPRLAENTEICVSGLGYDAVLTGAAALAIEYADLYHKVMDATQT